MQFATLLFYAISSFFLGLVAIATGGSNVLEATFDPNGLTVGGSHEPWQTILVALVIAVPLVFLLLALYSLVRASGDAPATASDIRDLIAQLDRRQANDRLER